MNRLKTPQKNRKNGSAGFVGITLLSIVAVSLVVSLFALNATRKVQRELQDKIVVAERVNAQKTTATRTPPGSNGQDPIKDVALGDVLIAQNKAVKIKLIAGKGIVVDGLKITNVDPGSAQKSFGKIKSGRNVIKAKNSDDTLTLTGGEGVTVSTDAKSRTLTVSINEINLGSNTTGDYVKNISAGTGISVDGNTGEGSSPQIGLSSTSVVAGSYTDANITVDAYGRITLATSGSGSSNIVTLGTITTGTWNGTAVDVAHGGTGDTSLTAYALLAGGTTTTGALQQVSGVGTTGQVLTAKFGIKVSSTKF